MIQDIAPHRFDNAFADRRVPRRGGDFVLLYREKQVLLRREGGEISFPRAEELIPETGADAGAFLSCTEGCSSIANSGEEGGGSPDGNPNPFLYEDGDGEMPQTPGYYRENGLTFIYLFAIDNTAFYSVDGWNGELPGCQWEDVGVFRTAAPGYLAFAGITGEQLFTWRQDHRFCGGCGARMAPSDTERAFRCPDCGRIVYPKICPAVIVAVTHGDRILLSRYAGRAHAHYALVAGFAEFGEPIEDTVRREVMEEVGLRVKNLRFYKSQPWSFSDTLLMGFYCELDGSEDITLDTNELAEAVWVRREDVPERSRDISLTSEMMERFRLGEM
ncbi:MAG: NAD(+) diphosphatase [Lachnospiraceae bacterium]|nr:NAD(+) diphosphatase [Lachnospiraceae bacterium]